MNPEKSFDPHNPQYKEVEDLPAEVRDRFTDVDGGFVRGKAKQMHTNAQDQADNHVNAVSTRDATRDATRATNLEKENLYKKTEQEKTALLNKSWRVWFFDKRMAALESTLAELTRGSKDNKVIDMEEDRSSREDFVLKYLTAGKRLYTTGKDQSMVDENATSGDREILQSREHYKALIDNYIDEQIDLARIEAFANQSEKLKELGHEGYLVLSLQEDYKEGYHPRRIQKIDGKIDERNILVTCSVQASRDKKGNYVFDDRPQYAGSIEGINSVDSREAYSIYNEYNSIAIDVKALDKELEQKRSLLLSYELPDDVDSRIKKLAEKISQERTEKEKKEEETIRKQRMERGDESALKISDKFAQEVAEQARKDLVTSLLPQTTVESSASPSFSNKKVWEMLGWAAQYPEDVEISLLPKSAHEILKWYYGDDISRIKTVGQIAHSANFFVSKDYHGNVNREQLLERAIEEAE